MSGLLLNTSAIATVKPRTGAGALTGELYATPEAAKAKTKNVMERMQWQLEAYGGIESLDFLDLPMDLFLTAVYTLWWGRKYA